MVRHMALVLLLSDCIGNDSDQGKKERGPRAV